MEEFLEQTRALTDHVRSLGDGAMSAMPEPVPSNVNRMLRWVQELIEMAPPLTAEFKVLAAQCHAQRLTVQVLQAELSAHGHRLQVLERSPALFRGWAHQWAPSHRSMTGALHSKPREPGSTQK
jgi:hypothetical protein